MPNKLIDLTQIINDNITLYPGTEKPEFEMQNTIEEHGYADLKMTTTLHVGTHIDAPCHVLKNAKSLDRFPPDKFIGKAIVIACSDRKELDLPFLKTYEDEIAQTHFVLFYTGWQHKWNTKEYFDDCPVPTIEAAKWLATFKLKGIGFDAFSVDKMVTTNKVTPENLPNHYILLEKEILLIENLTNMDKLPAGTFTFQCLPLYIEHAVGSPVRAIAMINGGNGE